MQLCNIGHSFDYETEKVIRIFLPYEKINITHKLCESDSLAVCKLQGFDGYSEAVVTVKLSGKQECQNEKILSLDLRESELAVSRCLYICLSKITGYKSSWGILTGIRPAKLFSNITASKSSQFAESVFVDDYLCSRRKAQLCKACAESEKRITDISTSKSFSLYVSVPFCPSRCSYCSFVSHSVENAKDIIPEYLRLLRKELKYTGAVVRRLKLRLETVYVGGGTPTSITARELSELLCAIKNNFDFSCVREFTVEAGRPDTIDAEKLQAIKAAGVTRISINPQSMNDEVLRAVGRRHTTAQMRTAFNLAKSVGFDNINTDLIAGLPSDTLSSFKNSLYEIIKLGPESVTVHSLSVKRAADITRKGNLPDFSVGKEAGKMVDFARKTLEENGFLPYYMYRQSKTVGNLENVGYSKPGFEGLYNVYIMDETHTILACGASAVSKLKEPGGNNIERIFNFKYPYEYINRFDEIISRKEAIKYYYDKYLGCNK
ncbi:MAG: coproporphyrinogen dehydrogenase HemZ [Clostridia bacterium]|nr:coproporphyrinogen dehydrogenase HemZ [Clostridia bacterium]